jgi:hypothetical protein
LLISQQGIPLFIYVRTARIFAASDCYFSFALYLLVAAMQVIMASLNARVVQLDELQRVSRSVQLAIAYRKRTAAKLMPLYGKWARPFDVEVMDHICFFLFETPPGLWSILRATLPRVPAEHTFPVPRCQVVHQNLVLGLPLSDHQHVFWDVHYEVVRVEAELMRERLFLISDGRLLQHWENLAGKMEYLLGLL